MEEDTQGAESEEYGMHFGKVDLDRVGINLNRIAIEVSSIRGLMLFIGAWIWLLHLTFESVSSATLSTCKSNQVNVFILPSLIFFIFDDFFLRHVS